MKFKKLILSLLMALCVIGCLNYAKPVETKAASKTTMYYCYLSQSKMSKSKGYLTVKTKENFEKGRYTGKTLSMANLKSCSKNKLHVKLSKKCKYRLFNVTQNMKDAEKSSYSTIKSYIKDAHNDMLEGGLIICVKNNRVVKVFVCLS